MTSPKVIINVYCTEPGDRVVAHSCPLCKSCWLFVAGSKKNFCPWGGPFTGTEKED